MTSLEIKKALKELGFTTIVLSVFIEGEKFLKVEFQSPFPQQYQEDLKNILRNSPAFINVSEHFVINSSRVLLPIRIWEAYFEIYQRNLRNPQPIRQNRPITRRIVEGAMPNIYNDMLQPTPDFYPSLSEVQTYYSNSLSESTLSERLTPDDFVGGNSNPAEQELKCDNCGKKMKINQRLYRASNHKYYCKTDFETLFKKCDNCSGYFEKEKYRNCDVCAFDICEICSQAHDCDSLSKPEREERRLIYKIAKERKLSPYNLNNPMKEVTFKFLEGNPEIKTKHIKINRFAGVEIEVEKGKRFGLNALLNPTMGISHDGSLDRNTGIELQTPPASLNELEHIITNTCQVLKKRGYKSSIKCGLHVHLDARDFKNNHKKIIQVIKTFYSIEDLIFSMLPPSRWASKYCQRLSKDYLYDSFARGKKADVEWYKEDNTNVLCDRKERKYDKSRYYGLNIHSIYHRGTVELRYHSGTVSEYKILMWVNFCLLVLEYALKNYKIEEIQYLFDNSTSRRKFDYMCRIFLIPSEMREYLLQRIHKFNTNFNIKFNQGKEKREIEKLTIDKIMKEMQDKIEEIKPRIVKKVREYFIDSCGIENPEIERNRDFCNAIQDNIDSQMRRLYPKEYGILPLESGFIKDEEIAEVSRYIEQGRTIEREIDQFGEREE